MSAKYVCSECKKNHDPETLVFRCECGGLLDLEKHEFTFSKKDILSSE